MASQVQNATQSAAQEPTKKAQQAANQGSAKQDPKQGSGDAQEKEPTSHAQSQVQNATEGAQGKVQGATSSAQDAVQSTTSGVLSSVQGYASKIQNWGQSVVDRVFPPEQRAAFLAKLQSFMLANPKLSAFLGMNIAITGIPLGLFFLFTLTIAIFALVVGLLIGLLAAVAFTLFCVGIALTVVLPTIFFTTMAACFLFLWGLGGYYLLKSFTSISVDGEGQGGGEGGSSIGDKLNSFTGGRLTGFMQGARAEQAKGGIEGFSDDHTKPQEQQKQPKANGSTEKTE